MTRSCFQSWCLSCERVTRLMNDPDLLSYEQRGCWPVKSQWPHSAGGGGCPSHHASHHMLLSTVWFWTHACASVMLNFTRSSLVKTVAVMTLCRPANVPKAVRQTVMIRMRHMSANIGLFWGDAAAAAAAAASEMDPPCYTWAHAWWLIQIASTDRINHQFTVQARWNPFRKLNLEP